jgi:hypothetical protein
LTISEPGSRVFLMETSEWAIFESMSELPNYAFVLLKTGEELLVHIEDISVTSPDQVQENEKSDPKNHLDNDRLSPPEIEFQGIGIWLYGITDKSGFAPEYQLWIVNQTSGMVSGKISLQSSQGELYGENMDLAIRSSMYFCELFREDLSLHPRFVFDVKYRNSDLIIDLNEVERFTPKKLLSSLSSENWHWIPVISEQEILKKQEEKIPKPIKNKVPVKRQFNVVHPRSIDRKASFPMSIDLHAEKLFENSTKSIPSEILKKQIHAFEKYLEEAILLGMSEVYIIHGIGTGRLKEHIHDKLRLMHGIQSFTNEFHPRYGWGATKVII